MAGVRLSGFEREQIRVGIEREESFAQIAASLGRVTSTVSREVGGVAGRVGYCAVAADRAAARRRCRPRPSKLTANPALAAHVQARLRAKDSPMTIAVELARAGGVGGGRVSHETIYRAVYAHGRGGLPAGLHEHLHRRRRCRKRRHRPGDLAPVPTTTVGALKQFTSITARPAHVADRVQPGHWEGDLIIGAGNASAIITLVERTSRYNLLGALPHGYGASAVLAALCELIERVPPVLRRSLTWDQGREMARHAELAAATGLDVYFAQAHHPWQRGSDENFNGILRRYVGKGTDLSVHTQADLDAISHRINTTPRRLHHWDSAADRYHQALVATIA